MHQKTPSGFSLFGHANVSSSSSTAAVTVEPLLVDVVPNRKANCVNNCLDCSISCEVEFPLDAVACIFDCLTEACVLADRNQRAEQQQQHQSSNLNRLASFESLAGGNAEARGPGNNNGGNHNNNNSNNNNAEDAANSSIMPPQYQHIHVPNSKDKYETYLTLAFESAVLALGKQRIMPQGLYSQHVVCKQQDQLIARLQHIDLDLFLVGVLKNSTIQMMDGGPTSGFGVTIHPESVPMHTLARFLFTSLLNYYPDLAFQAGLRAMRLPVLEEPNEDRIPQNGGLPNHNQQQPEGGNAGGGGNNQNHLQGQNNNAGEENRRYGFILSRYSRWWTLGHLETQQCSLSSAMLSAAKAEPSRLAGVLESARRNIHSSSHLFKVSVLWVGGYTNDGSGVLMSIRFHSQLAQDAFRYATTDASSRSKILLSVAFELGLQVMRMTLTCLNWRRREMVRWLVTCATHLGLDALISIMEKWYQLFTPTEATGPVATTIMSHSTIMRLNLNLRVSGQDQLTRN